MKRLLFFILASWFLFLTCKTETKTIKIDTKKEKIDELLERYSLLKRFSGSVLVIKQDSIIYNSSYGKADYENSKPFTYKTAFKIGSISELITKDIIQKLALNGTINLDDSISKYIPQLKVKITINDLIHHQTNFPSIEDIIIEHPKLEYNSIAFANVINDSLSKENKSNLNYNILGTLIERISGKSFQQNIEDYSKALKLENTFYTNSDVELANGYQYHNYRNEGLELQKASSYNTDIAFSARGLKSTVKDLAKIVNHNLNEVININGYTPNDGFSYSLKNNPDNKTCIIVLSNFKQPITDEISNSIASILESKSYQLPLERKSFHIDSKTLNSFTGKYALNEYVKFRVINRNDSLFAILGPNETYLIPQSNNQFYMQDRDAAMRFLRDTSSKVDRVELLDGFIDGQIANRINE